MTKSGHMVPIGERIRQVREDKGWSMTELARRTKPPVTPSAIKNWECGRREPKEDMLMRVALALGVSIAFLRYGTDEAEGKPGDTGYVEIRAQDTPVQIPKGFAEGIAYAYTEQIKRLEARLAQAQAELSAALSDSEHERELPSELAEAARGQNPILVALCIALLTGSVDRAKAYADAQGLNEKELEKALRLIPLRLGKQPRA